MKFDTIKKKIPKKILAETELKTADSSVKVIVHPKMCRIHTSDDEMYVTDLALNADQLLPLITQLAEAHSLLLGHVKEAKLPVEAGPAAARKV